MGVRQAAADDLDAIEALALEFEREVPPPEHVDIDRAHEVAQIHEIVGMGLGFVHEREGSIDGFALARIRHDARAVLTDLYVAPGARQNGVAAQLVAAVARAVQQAGAAHLELEVMTTNTRARSVYQKWGFREYVLTASAPIDGLLERLSPDRHSVSFGSIHVQNDDRGWVEKTAREFAPRIGSPGSRVEGPRNGWTSVYDPVIDDDPGAMLRYARELSDRMGAVVIALSLEVDQVVRLIALDRGGIVDEYLSVPEFYGPLPPGDVIGLAANPTVLARLTGADPSAVRRVAVTAETPSDLPPPAELLESIAGVLGIEGATHGFGYAVGDVA